jgi:protocatechuate 3,4-dioxygenase beta subunit
VKRADGRGGVAFSSWNRTTDDHGRLRLFGLDRGSYILCVEVDALRSTQTPNPGSRRERLIATCYPSTDESQAEAVSLEDVDAGEVEIRMRLGRTFTVSGRVVDASGAPAPHAMVGLARFTANSSSGTSLPVDAEGSFTLAGVQPGEYAIEATVGGPDRPEHRQPLEAAFLPIRVDADLEGLVVSMTRGVDVSGRVTLEDSATELPRPPGSGVMFIARLADDRLPGTGSSRHARMRDDRTFTLEGMFGTRVLAVENVPRGWHVKSIRYGAKEIADEPVEFKGGPDAPIVEIVLSNRGAVVTGRVLDDGGNPARGARVVVLWAGARAGARPVAETRVSSTGVFRAGPVRGGDYLVVALPASAPPFQLAEWDRLARLAAVAERVTLGELDERVLDLRVVTER